MFFRIICLGGALLLVAVLGSQFATQYHCTRWEARSVKRTLALVAFMNHSKIRNPSASYEEILSIATPPFGAFLQENAKFHLLPDSLRKGELEDVDYVIAIDSEPGGLCFPVCVFSNGYVVNTSWQALNE